MRLHRWHRRVGALVAVLLVVLVLTGVALQHSASLELGRRYVTAPLALDWYGLQPPEDAWSSQGIVSVGDRIFLDGVSAPVELNGFRGAVSAAGLLVAAGEQEVLLLEPASGLVVDRFAIANVRRIGLHDGAPLLEVPTGLLLADGDLLDWQPLAAPVAAVSWAALERPADPAPFRTRYRERMLTLERVVQDAHSGRLFGWPGVLLMDAASALLVFLAISGLLMWGRTLRR